MNEVTSKEIAVLYRVDHLYGWRANGEFLPKRAEIFATLARVDREVTAIRTHLSDYALAEYFDEIVSRKFSEVLEKGASLFENDKAAYQKRESAMNIADFLSGVGAIASRNFSDVLDDVDAYVKYITDNPESDLAIIVVGALLREDLSVLKEHEGVCVRLL